MYRVLLVSTLVLYACGPSAAEEAAVNAEAAAAADEMAEELEAMLADDSLEEPTKEGNAEDEIFTESTPDGTQTP